MQVRRSVRRRLSVVGPATAGADDERRASKPHGGVPTDFALRRTVIDRMIRENGLGRQRLPERSRRQKSLRRGRSIAGQSRQNAVANVLFHRIRRAYLQRGDQRSGSMRLTV